MNMETLMSVQQEDNPTLTWPLANWRYLMAELERIRFEIDYYMACEQEEGPDETHVEARRQAVQAAVDDAASAMPSQPALARVCAVFGLSPFERDLLLFCAGIELHTTFANLVAKAQGDQQRRYATFSLALAVLPNVEWRALTPAAALRYWRLIELGPGTVLTDSPLRIAERVLHFLTGTNDLDEQLEGRIEPARSSDNLVPSHDNLAEQIATIWAQTDGQSVLPVIQLCGTERMDKQAVAANACERLGLNLYVIPVHAIPTTPGDLDVFVRLWAREVALSRRVLLIDGNDLTDSVQENAIAHLMEQCEGGVLISSEQRRRTRQRPMVSFDVPKPPTTEQHDTWHAALGPIAVHLNGHVTQLLSQFNMSAPAIRTACNETLHHLMSETHDTPTAATIANLLWDTCRTQARPHLDDLAQRIEPSATWDDLVLPEAQRSTLNDIVAHVRQRTKVYEQWGLGHQGERGLGISALFAGVSGTGKTMAAEVLAHELRLDLYHIDLSTVVSKYIGETEKNLRRIFDAAEAGGVILLFDEADAIFGKRSEVKDSHDRHANIEVSYLLQRMEAYRGLAVLTTNLKHALDTAFLRRIRFVVQFPFPDAVHRTEIWCRVYPSTTPTDGLDVSKLARLNVAGGNIRNIALNAAFLAADADEPVRMCHLRQAARNEYLKLEKPLTELETQGWV